MKNKILLFIMLLAVCVIPMGVNAKEFNVTLKSIEFVEKGGNASQVSDPSIDELNINLNMRFEKLNDYITYKLLVENKDKEDYNLVTDFDDEYVKYEFSTTNIKKNTTTEIKITAKYVKELPDNLKDQQINKVVKLNVTDKQGNILNPKTGQNFYIIIALLLIVGLITIFVIKKKKSKELGFIALILLLTPISVLAAKELSITINSTYEIKDSYLYAFIQNGDIVLNSYELSDNCTSSEFFDWNLNPWGGEISQEDKERFCNGEELDDETSINRLLEEESDNARYLADFTQYKIIKNADITVNGSTSNYEDLHKEVFIKFKKDFSELYTCTMYKSEERNGKPICLKYGDFDVLKIDIPNLFDDPDGLKGLCSIQAGGKEFGYNGYIDCFDNNENPRNWCSYYDHNYYFGHTDCCSNDNYCEISQDGIECGNNH